MRPGSRYLRLALLASPLLLTQALILFASRFSSGTLPAGVALEGNAWLDSDFGVNVDGEGDGIALGPTSAEGWSGDDVSSQRNKGSPRAV